MAKLDGKIALITAAILALESHCQAVRSRGSGAYHWVDLEQPMRLPKAVVFCHQMTPST